MIPIRKVYRAGSFLVSFSPGALYKRAAAGHNTPRHAAIMRCTRPLTTPTAGVSFVHSRRSRRSSLGDNLVPAFTGAVRFCEAVHSIAATYYILCAVEVAKISDFPDFLRIRLVLLLFIL